MVPLRPEDIPAHTDCTWSHDATPDRDLWHCSRQTEGTGSCWGRVLVPLSMMVTMGCTEPGGLGDGTSWALESQRFPEGSQTCCPLNCQPGGCSRARGHPPPLPSLLAWPCRGSSALCQTPNTPGWPVLAARSPPGAAVPALWAQASRPARVHRVTLHEFLCFSTIHGCCELGAVHSPGQGCPAAQGYPGIPHSLRLLGAAKSFCAPRLPPASGPSPPSASQKHRTSSGAR